MKKGRLEAGEGKGATCIDRIVKKKNSIMTVDAAPDAGATMAMVRWGFEFGLRLCRTQGEELGWVVAEGGIIVDMGVG